MEKEVFIFFGFLEIKMVIEILVKECSFILCFVCKTCRQRRGYEIKNFFLCIFIGEKIWFLIISLNTRALHVPMSNVSSYTLWAYKYTIIHSVQWTRIQKTRYHLSLMLNMINFRDITFHLTREDTFNVVFWLIYNEYEMLNTFKIFLIIIIKIKAFLSYAYVIDFISRKFM